MNTGIMHLTFHKHTSVCILDLQESAAGTGFELKHQPQTWALLNLALGAKPPTLRTQIGWLRIPVAHRELNYCSVTSQFLFFCFVLILADFSAIVGSSSEIGCDIPWANSMGSLFSKGNISHLAPSFDLPVPIHLPELTLTL